MSGFESTMCVKADIGRQSEFVGSRRAIDRPPILSAVAVHASTAA
jgi:hypothetical protein